MKAARRLDSQKAIKFDRFMNPVYTLQQRPAMGELCHAFKLYRSRYLGPSTGIPACSEVTGLLAMSHIAVFCSGWGKGGNTELE